MSNPIFIQQIINNNKLSFSKAMPLKDSTSNGTSNFEVDRKIYSKTYNPPLTDANAVNLLKSHYLGPNGVSRIRPTVFDGTHTPIQKKWMGSSNRDASQIITNRRTTSVGKGSLNLQSSTINSPPNLVGSSIYSFGTNDTNNYWSPDGINWNMVELNLFPIDTIWTGSYYIATGGNIDDNKLTIATSTNGINWTENIGSQGFFDYTITAATNDNIIIAMGPDTESEKANFAYSLIRSTDYGNTWTAIEYSDNIFRNQTNLIGTKLKGGLKWNGHVWVGVGSGGYEGTGPYNSIAYSTEPNGSIWQGGISTVSDSRDTATSIFEVGTALANNGNLWVATGFTKNYGNGTPFASSNIIAWSEDGVSWTPATVYYNESLITSGLPFICSDVAFNGNMWVASACYLGDGPVISFIFTSTDGKTWNFTALSQQQMFLLSVIWNGLTWIVNGLRDNGNNQPDGISFYSKDGVNWNTNNNESHIPFLKIAWNGITNTNSTNVPLSFTNGNDKNLLNHTLRRVRSGGAVAPPKKSASPSHTYVPSPGTHPYLQPGYKGKNPGDFPALRFNK